MPELDPDEALVVNQVLNLINNVPTDYTISFFGRAFPFMSTCLHGALECYLLFPFLFFGGATLEALRLGPIFWGIIILLLTYYFCCKFFNPLVGVMSVILLALNSSFLFFLKVGPVFGFSVPIFSLASLLCLHNWHKTRKNLYFILGILFLTFGFNAKGTFIRFIVALFIIGFFYMYRNRIRTRTIFIGLVSFALGLIPAIYYNLKTGHYSRFIFNNAISTEHGGNNAHFITSLLVRLKQLNIILQGSIVLESLQIFVFWISLIWLLCSIFFVKKTILSKEKIIFVVSLFSLTLMMSTITFTGLSEGHLYILFPYIQIIIGIAIFESIKYLQPRLRKVIIFLLILALGIVNIGKCVSVYSIFKYYRDCEKFSNSYVLTKWLLENKIHNPICAVVRLYEPIIFYSNLRIEPLLLRYNPSHDTLFSFSNEFKKIMKKNSKPENVFILGPGDQPIEYNIFNSLAKESNKEIVTLKKFFYSDGNIRFIICTLK